MKFSELILEARGTGITFVDIDETLFSTNALIYVVKDGTVIKKLTNAEFNTYSLAEGETFDFREFKDSELFSNTSKPIETMINKVVAMFKNISAAGSEMYLLTARGDFNDKDKFLEFLRSYNIKVGHIKDGHIHVIRAGNEPGSSAMRKQTIIRDFLQTEKYERVRLYDDAKSNLTAFIALKDEFPSVTFEAFIVDHGKVSKFKS
jgi:hypothetical protein